MCKKCDELRWQIEATRTPSTELTDPASIVLNKADIRALEESLIRAAMHHPAAEKDTWENRDIASAR